MVRKTTRHTVDEPADTLRLGVLNKLVHEKHCALFLEGKDEVKHLPNFRSKPADAWPNPPTTGQSPPMPGQNPPTVFQAETRQLDLAGFAGGCSGR